MTARSPAQGITEDDMRQDIGPNRILLENATHISLGSCKAIGVIATSLPKGSVAFVDVSNGAEVKGDPS